MTKSKRVLSRKVTSFNMYLDQANQIQGIMEDTGVDRDAPVLRELLDEALAGRRRKVAEQLSLVETAPPSPQLNEAIETIQTLLVKLIEQGEKARSVRGISLELLQEALAESRAGRKLMMSKLIGRPDSENALQVYSRSEPEIDEARQHAYHLATKIAKATE